MKSRITKIVIAIIVVGLAAGGIYYWKYAGAPPLSFRTTTVARGDLLATISATGTVMPEELVDVGAQVGGQILSFGTDLNKKQIDYRSEVDEGMVLAKIDESVYQSSVDSAKAALELADAGVIRAQADLKQMQAKLVAAQNDWDRAQKLHGTDALAETQYDAYKSTYETAKALVGVDEAAIKQATATVSQATANLKSATRNLQYCTIRSPVKGVIIDRRVNIGQTVNASLSAPSLFLIAKDLKQMQVWVQVNEADIGNIYAGQPVTFNVDTRPGQTFVGQVGKVRFNAQQTQNVVTYTVEMVTDNSGGELVPYQTANVEFEQSRRQNVLMVPNAALRWFPTPEMIAPEFQQAAAELQKPVGAGAGKRAGATSAPASADPKTGVPGVRSDDPRHKRESAATTTTGPATTQPTTSPDAGPLPPRFIRGVLWVRYGAFVKPIKVRAGLSDGTNTEVQGDELTEGMEVIVDQQKGAAAGTNSANPFTPQIPRRGGGGGR
jgi:HlyD family secretion protein